MRMKGPVLNFFRRDHKCTPEVYKQRAERNSARKL